MATYEINGIDIKISKSTVKKFPYDVTIFNSDGNAGFDCTLEQLRTLAYGLIAYVNKESNVKTKAQARTKRNG